MGKTCNRDDFSKRTKDTLAKRVAFHCSNPDCNVSTVASACDPSGFVNIGVAAHICAAAAGGKRYDPTMTSKERSDIQNGIWLCETCAKLIDSDERAFPVALLQAWKKSAEDRARDRLAAHREALQAQTPSGMNVLYLYRLVPRNGYRHIKNRNLVDTLKKSCSVTLGYGILEDRVLSAYEKEVRDLYIPASMLAGYDAVVIEGELGDFKEDGSLDTEKFSADVLHKYKCGGGVLIFLSDEQPDRLMLPRYNQFLKYVGFPLLETPKSEWQFPGCNHGGDETSYIYGIDLKRAIEGACTCFHVDPQPSRKLGPIPDRLLQGVETLSVCLPLQLSASAHAFLVGNDTTAMLSDDCYWDGSLFHIFGAYNDTWAGTAILITGGICNDILLKDSKSDAIRLVQNLIQFFVEAEAQRKALLSIPGSERNPVEA